MKRILITIFLFLVSGAALAADVRVVDSRGLTRAMKEVKGRASVVLNLGDMDDSIRLSNVDGIAGNKQGRKDGSRLIFEGVTEGTWKIISDAKGAANIRSVKIAEER